MLYALHQQATVGPCTEGKPWAWNVVESAKWQSWVQLGDMSSVEAMRLYVKLLDEEVQARSPSRAREAAGPAAAVAVQARSRLRARRAQPDWWARKEAAAAAPPPADAEPDAAPPPPGDAHALEAAAAADAWVAPHMEGARRPPPRYEHAVAELGGHMYVVGGNCGAPPLRRPPLSALRGRAPTARARAQAGATWATCGRWSWRRSCGAPSAASSPRRPRRSRRRGRAMRCRRRRRRAACRPAPATRWWPGAPSCSAWAGTPRRVPARTPAPPPMRPRRRREHAAATHPPEPVALQERPAGAQVKDAAAALTVRAFDTLARTWTLLSPSGQAPSPRGSHSVRPSGWTAHAARAACRATATPPQAARCPCMPGNGDGPRRAGDAGGRARVCVWRRGLLAPPAGRAAHPRPGRLLVAARRHERRPALAAQARRPPPRPRPGRPSHLQRAGCAARLPTIARETLRDPARSLRPRARARQRAHRRGLPRPLPAGVRRRQRGGLLRGPALPGHAQHGVEPAGHRRRRALPARRRAPAVPPCGCTWGAPARRRRGARARSARRAPTGRAARRAGHAGALLGDAWYVAGGGNNAAGCADMLALDLGGLGAAPLAWAPVATAEPRSAIASEGLSLLAAPGAGVLVAFGGYNGRYHNTVQLFRPGAPRPRWWHAWAVLGLAASAAALPIARPPARRVPARPCSAAARPRHTCARPPR